MYRPFPLVGVLLRLLENLFGPLPFGIAGVDVEELPGGEDVARLQIDGVQVIGTSGLGVVQELLGLAAISVADRITRINDDQLLRDGEDIDPLLPSAKPVGELHPAPEIFGLQLDQFAHARDRLGLPSRSIHDPGGPAIEGVLIERVGLLLACLPGPIELVAVGEQFRLEIEEAEVARQPFQVRSMAAMRSGRSLARFGFQKLANSQAR